MTLNEFYKTANSTDIIVYIKDEKEVYKVTDLDYDSLDGYIIKYSCDIGGWLYFLVVQKKEDKSSIEVDKLKQRISDMDDELRNLTDKWLSANCFPNTCKDCPFNGRDKTYDVATGETTPCKHAVLRLNILKAFRDASEEVLNESK